VSAPYEDSAATGVNGNQADNSMPNAGAVYVFTRSGTTWSQQAYVKASNSGDPEEGDQFGYAISLSGDGNLLAVGAIGEDSAATTVNGDEKDNSAPNAGAAYVFVRSGGTWAQQAYLKAKEGDPQDSMGCSISISDDGNTVATGALDEDTMVGGINVVQSGHSGKVDGPDDNSSGAAYVFVRNGTTWTEQANFKASNVGKDDWFGIHLHLSGDGNMFAVTAPNEDGASQGINGKQDVKGADEAGAVYLFNRQGTTWSQQVYFKASNAKKFDEFGSAVALSRDGRTMAVGAHFESSGAKGVNGNQLDTSMSQSGAVYIFAR
jgi:FG-GAP repeat protein